MSDSSLKHQLKVITIPVFIEIALVMLLGAVDTIMLSHYSDNSVAAVGLDNQLFALLLCGEPAAPDGASPSTRTSVGSSCFVAGAQESGAAKGLSAKKSKHKESGTKCKSTFYFSEKSTCTTVWPTAWRVDLSICSIVSLTVCQVGPKLLCWQSG